VGEVGGWGREMGLGISIYNFLRSNKLGRRKCTASWLSLASFGHLPLSQFVNYCKMNFFTDDHAGTETLRPWYCTASTVTVTWPNSSCRFLASSQWDGMAWMPPTPTTMFSAPGLQLLLRIHPWTHHFRCRHCRPLADVTFHQRTFHRH